MPTPPGPRAPPGTLAPAAAIEVDLPNGRVFGSSNPMSAIMRDSVGYPSDDRPTGSAHTVPQTGPTGTHHRIRSGDEPVHARSPLRLRLGLALTGLANGLAGVIVFALLG